MQVRRSFAAALGSLIGFAAVALASAETGDGKTTSSLPGFSAQQVEALLADPATALREAQRARAAGDFGLAEELLRGVATRHPVIADHAQLMLIELLLDGTRPAEAVVVALEALRDQPGSPLRDEFHRRLGSARADLGDEEGARAAWGTGARETRSDSLEAQLLLSIGESLERSGQLRAAASTYQTIWVSHPTSDAAEPATRRLEILEEQLGSQRTANDWRRRADRLFRSRYNPEALDAYDRALVEGLSRSAARRAKEQRAHTLFRMRRYPEAVLAFSGLPKNDDNALWHARSLARSGDVMRSIDELEALGRKARTGTMRTRATFLAALLLDGRGFEERANAHFAQVARSSASSMSSAALWRLGWAAYRGGRLEEAIERFERLIPVDDTSAEGMRGRYWRARALGKLGDPRAVGEFTELANEYPFTYYGWLSRTRARPEPPKLPAQSFSDGSSGLLPEQLERPRILLEAGLLEAASSELGQLRRKARGVRDRIELSGLLADSGDFTRAQQLMIGAYDDRLSRGPTPRYEDIWWHAWPAAYWELVRQATAQDGSVEPALVLSIMREESGYRAAVISPVGARGLMQIMIPTGERLAEQVGMSDFDPDDLFDPQINIRLGAHYLTSLSKRFGGRLSAAIASYNAGPDAVSSWGPSEPGADDEWIEAIPYDQTRSYVKRVLRSLRAYQVLY